MEKTHNLPEPKSLHIIPVNDLRPHSHQKDVPCWCNPDVSEEEGVLLFTHHSMDGREFFETGERKPS